MPHWGRVLIIAGLLLTPALSTGAADPYSGGVEASPQQSKAQGAFSSTRGAPAGRVVPQAPAGTGVGNVPRASATRAPGTISDMGKDYKIGPHDVLDISVFGVPDLSGTVEVAENGSAQLPLIGEVPAAGKTAEEVEKDVTSRLKRSFPPNG
jgi:polysaccharide export outer membrane protein